MPPPQPHHFLRSLAYLMEGLIEDTGHPHPVHDLRLPGVRMYYGLLESA